MVTVTNVQSRYSPMGNVVRRMRFGNYQHIQARINSFETEDFVDSINKTVNDFAEAGFFYTGTRDETICYYCGGGVRDWKDDDDPWVEHARWFSRCWYLHVTKGKDFVDECCGQKKKGNQNNKSTTTANDVIEVPEAIQCIICVTNPRNVVFLPCGHCCICESCSLKVKTCVFCRTGFHSLVKIYFP